MMKRIVLLLLAVALPAQAGLSYHFTTKFRSNGYESQSSGRVLVSNDSYRLELERDPTGQREYDIAISTDGDQTASLINVAKSTVWQRRRVEGRVVSSRLFLLPGGFESKLDGEAVISQAKEPGGVIAGFATTKRTISLTFHLFADFDGTPFHGVVHAIATIWTAPSLPRLPLQRGLSTGIATIDTELAAIANDIRGMTLRHELVVTRTVEGGPAITESVSTNVDWVVAAATTRDSFAIPPGMREREYALDINQP
jgi:hypothetical protein